MRGGDGFAQHVSPRGVAARGDTARLPCGQLKRQAKNQPGRGGDAASDLFGECDFAAPGLRRRCWWASEAPRRGCWSVPEAPMREWEGVLPMPSHRTPGGSCLGRRILQVPGAVTPSSLARRERSSETRSVRVPLPWPAWLFGCAFRCRHGTRRGQKYHVLPSEAARGPLSQSPPHATHRAHVRTLATAADRAIMRAEE